MIPTKVAWCWAEGVVGHDDWRPLHALWKRSWENQGYIARTVGWAEARRHPLFDKLEQLCRSRPTHNGWDYEFGCWARWLAMDVMMLDRPGEACLMTDMDAMAYDFGEARISGYAPEVLDEPVVFLEQHVGNAVVWASRIGRRQLVEWMFDYDHLRFGHYDQASDMMCWKAMTEGRHDKVCPKFPPCLTVWNAGWEKAPAVHFATCGLARIGYRVGGPADKTHFIMKLRPVP